MTPEERAAAVWDKYCGESTSYTEPMEKNIARHIRAAIAEEREACAALAQSKAPGWTCMSEHDHAADGWSPECIAALIRART